MKIAIMYRISEAPWGGGNSFIRSLRRAWEEMGLEIVDRLQGDLDGVLLNSCYLGADGSGRLTGEMARRAIRYGYFNHTPALIGISRWRRKGYRPPFVHRLDGVFRLYGRAPNNPDDIAQIEINRFVDWTVYQSAYGRMSFANEGVNVSRSSVIFNSVDTKLFYPAAQPPSMRPFRLIMVAWSDNIRKGASYIIKASGLVDVEVTYVGRWPKELPKPNIRFIPPQTHIALADILREHHALLNMTENETCSNSILEAIASGLPVIYHKSGGSPEIVQDCGVEGQIDISVAIEELRDRYRDLRERTLARHPSLAIINAASAYLKVFSDLGHQSI